MLIPKEWEKNILSITEFYQTLTTVDFVILLGSISFKSKNIIFLGFNLLLSLMFSYLIVWNYKIWS